MCAVCGDWGSAGQDQTLSQDETAELALLQQLLDDLDCEPDTPPGWVVPRDSLVPAYAQAHDAEAQVLHDRAELCPGYQGKSFLAFYDYLLHDGIRQGRHAGHEVQYVQEDTIEYLGAVVRVAGAALHLAEEVTTEDGVPADPYLYCCTCEERIPPKRSAQRAERPR